MLRKNRGKAQRRRKDAARMKARARRVYPHDPQARAADHLAVCSCPVCGNPRRHFSAITIQERRAADRMRQSLDAT